MSFDRAALILIAVSVLGFAATAHADARMYTGSLVIHAFGNDTSTVNTFPFISRLGIPLTGSCHTVPYHPKETLTFPTTPTGTQVFTFTIPAYGGAQITVDAESDSVPMLTRWVGAGETSTASIGILKLTFAPEPGILMMLGAGATMVR